MNKIYDIFKQKALVFFEALVFCLLFSVTAGAVNITNMRIGQQVGSVRVVFDADSKFDYEVFLLSDPKRLVVDAHNADIKKALSADKNNLISSTRVGKLNEHDKRVVFDLQKPVLIKQAFMLEPSKNTNWRLVIDLVVSSERDFSNKVGVKYALSNKTGTKNLASKATNTSKSNWLFSSDKASKPKPRQKIIVLDPGHGGKDPGAVGAYGKTFEKNVTLAMGKELKAELERRVTKFI